MKDISELDCSEKFLRDNFKQATYIDNQGKERAHYVLNDAERGFMFLIFGYEGEKALYYKIQFIKQFKAMEKFLGADSSDIFNSIFTKVGK